MPTISKNSDCITIINVFTVEPTHQQQLMDMLVEATRASVRHAPGFISVSFHRSLDGTKVTAYAQWRSISHYHTMRNDPEGPARMEKILAIASFAPGIYEVAETFVAD